MYLFYIDESGDVGRLNSPSRYFVLSAVCVHESAWQQFLDETIEFRRYLKKQYGLRMRDEIHASLFLTGNPGLNVAITKNDKVMMLRDCLRFLGGRGYLSIVTVRIEKDGRGSADIFEYAWKILLQRIHNTIVAGNFAGNFKDDKGLIVCDSTDASKLRMLLRKMRRYNKVPSMFDAAALDAKVISISEDPVHRDSKTSYIHQLVDVVCYFARQSYEPNSTVRKKGLRNYYISNLKAVLNVNCSPKNTANHVVELTK